ncbi:MAG: DUF6379 domain-containing protein [Faecalicatena sp.]|uniref:C-glycoside deglycosidase beta subunit domain-containing protein n=1 Tax=Faecalicatena sp. TaxID=2005360 RepID=UPI002590755B|nr:DUF6379 domain-containing protein [Faecalicatena sp.]MCI6465679.1 DUF6379 domain-containing protein [Faecalicatena sp.]MDY5618046.1 DUF6379 domain-containing protein [Lachnospiraceae bacterium]
MGFVLRAEYTDILRNLENYFENGKKAGYHFDVRLAYYRGHYLSTIDELGVEVDGEKIEDEFIRFCVNGKEFLPCQLKEAYYEFWNIKTAAKVKIKKAGGLKAGSHNVKLTLMLRCPYLPLPGSEEQYTPIDSCDERELILEDTID